MPQLSDPSTDLKKKLNAPTCTCTAQQAAPLSGKTALQPIAHAISFQ